MARRKRAATRTRTIVRSVPTGPKTIVVRAPTAVRARRVARRVGGRIQSAALSEKHTMAALLAAGLLGLAERSGVKLPTPISQLSVPATYGLAMWGLGKYSRNQQWQHAATGLLAIAVRDLAAGKLPAGVVVGDDYETAGVGVVYGADDDD